MIRLLALLLTVLAGAADATQDGWPALFDVTGVASDDVLNIRAEPSAEAEIVGEFAHNARGIEVLRPGEDHRWGLVNTNEGTGWVSLAFLARRSGQWDGAPPPIESCFGTEPFWRLETEPGRIGSGDPGTWTLATPEGAELTLRAGRMGGALNDRGAFAQLAQDESRAHWTLFFHKRECSDGMSDRSYGIGAAVIGPGEAGPEILIGCCSLTGR